jgi:hypothetical protein
VTKETEEDVLRVLAVQGEAARKARDGAICAGTTAESAIAKAEATLRARGIALPERSHTIAMPTLRVPELRPWEVLVAEAKLARQGDISFCDVLLPEENAEVKAKLDGWGAEFADLHRLTAYDYAVAGAAGVLAGLVDVFLVQVPKHPGFLGGEGSDGGWLSNLVKGGFGKILPQDKINALEKSYGVPYDVSRNGILGEAIKGFGPRTHRLHSLGHDPILGWIFGVWDILRGTLTAIGGDGRILIQQIPGMEPVQIGWDIFARIVDALKNVAGHMISDVATPAGLPPPLFALLQFLQFGDIKGRTIADLSRAMYRSGYDFRHFFAGGVCVALIEVIVRVAWFARELHDGKSLMEALPVGNKPRLQTGLFLAHATAAAVNAGKVAITNNPLSVSWAQWLAFFRYLLPQAHWVLAGQENARHQFVQGKIDENWRQIAEAFAADYRLLQPIGVIL